MISEYWQIAYPWIVEQLKTNDFLVAGVGTIIVGSLVWGLRYVRDAIEMLITNYCCLELTISNDSDELYQAISSCLNEYRIGLLARNYSLFYKWRQNAAKWTLAPGYGTELYFYRGTLCKVTRKMHENASGSHKVQETLRIIFFTRRNAILQKFINECKTLYDEEPQGIRIFTERYDGDWEYAVTKPYRPLNTVFVNGNIRSSLLAAISTYDQNKKFKLGRGLNHKLGILLHGEPGCGKSSLIMALATELNKSVRILGINGQMTKSAFEEAFMSCGEDSILVLEDIDCFEAVDRESSKGKGLTTGVLLNMLDGIKSPNSIIYVATTNHLKKLDPALIREGRFDLKLEVDRLDKETILRMFNDFYQGSDALAKIIDSYTPITGAQAENVLLRRNTADIAAKEIVEFK